MKQIDDSRCRIDCMPLTESRFFFFLISEKADIFKTINFLSLISVITAGN
jgi:hypothetical protein